MSHRRVAIWLLALVGAVIALAGVAVFLLATLDLRPLIERAATRSLDRRVSIAELHVTWGNPISVEIRDLRLANAPGATAPDMLRIATLSAAIDPWPLLRGVLRYRMLRVEKPVIILERDAAGIGNWKFKGGGTAAGGGLALVPKNRTQFPTLIDFALKDGALDYRISSGAWLRLRLHDVTVHAAGDDAPATLAAAGSYNGAEARLTAATQSFAVMRNGSIPFGADFTLTTASSKIDFTGAMTDPLDFDGVRGKLDVDARNFGALLAVLGADLPAAFPLRAAGALAKNDTHWALADATGAFGDSAFAGTLTLDEGARAHPDALALALDFARLDVAPLLPTPTGDGNVALALEQNPGVTINARIGARQLRDGALSLETVTIAGRTAPGAIEISALSFAFAGGQVDATAAAHSVDRGSRVTASAALSGADAGKLAATLGAAPGQIAGRLDGAAQLEMSGATLNDALKVSEGRAALAMTEGRVARDLLEKASTDLRALFRAGEGSAAITCLLGVMNMQNGIGHVAPLTLRTPETNLLGGGTIDFVNRSLDLTIKGDASSSILALNIPLRLSGDLTSPHITPAIGAALPAPDARALTDAMAQWPPALQNLAERNSCLPSR